MNSARHCEHLEHRRLLSRGTVDFTPAIGARDVVYDDTRNLLYVSTQSGEVLRYDPATRAVVGQWTFPGQVRGIDLSPGDGTLAVAVKLSSGGQVQMIDLSDGGVETFPLPAGASPSDYPLDIVAQGSKFLVVSGDTNRLFEIDPLTHSNSWVTGRGIPSGPSGVAVRAGDRGSSFFSDGSGVWPKTAIYDATTQTASAPRPLSNDSVNLVAAMNKDGSLLALRAPSTNGRLGLYLFTSDFSDRGFFQSLIGGAVFDPDRPMVYGIDPASDQLVAIDTQTMRRQYSVPLGRDMAAAIAWSTGLTAAGDGHVFIVDPTGIVDVQLPTPDGEIASLELDGVSAFSRAGEDAVLRVRALDATGGPATAFQGVVQLTSNNVDASLPAEVDFTAATAGEIRVPIELQRSGSYNFTATATASDGSAITAALANRVAYTGVVSSVPVTGHDQVFDPHRNRLYVATANGTIERFDLETGRLLAPIPLSMYIGQIDLAPDGSVLYVANVAYGGFSKRVWGIDLNRIADDLPDLVAHVRFWNLDSGWDYQHATRTANFFGGIAAAADGNVLCDNVELDPDAGFLPDRWTTLIHSDRYTHLSRSSDHRYVLLDGPGTTAWYVVALYDTVSRSIVMSRGQSGLFDDYSFGGVNRNATRFATRSEYLDSNLARIAPLDGFQGFAFSNSADAAYYFAKGTNQLYIMRDANWTASTQVGVATPYSVDWSDQPVSIAVSANDEFVSIAFPDSIRLIRPQSWAGSYAAQEGTALSMTGRSLLGEFLPVQQWEWDLDYDGATFDVDASGPTYTFSAGDPRIDGPRTITVALRTLNSAGQRMISTGTLTISNVAPSIAVTAPALMPIGVPVTISFSATDPGNDTITGWTVTWPDGATEQLAGDATSATRTLTGVSEGQRTLKVTATDEDGTFVRSIVQFVGTAPTVTAVHRFGGMTPDVLLTFSEALSFNPSMTLTNLTTNTRPFVQLVRTGNSYSIQRRAGGVIVPLPEGLYRLTISAANTRDLSGISLDGNGDGIPGDDYLFTFRVLPGDADADGDVDFDDLLVLVRNYGSSGRTFAEGNFNYDPQGGVDFDDLLLLAQRYGSDFVSAPASGRRRERAIDVLAT